MTVRDRIIEHLGSHPEGIDDDVMAVALGLSRRQHANQECRKLENAGLVERRRVDGKTRNFLRHAMSSSLAAAEVAPSVRTTSPEETRLNAEKPWDWEGSVQGVVAAFLVSKGFTIQRVANTLTREQGKDIVAIAPSGRGLWVSVKGRPEGTPRTSPYLMAKHYFENAVHDLLRWRDEDKAVALALAFPDFVTYRNSAKKVAGQLGELKACIFWVSENRKVETSSSQYE